MSLRGLSLRTRLTLGALLGSAVALALLVLGFNLVLDARLRADADKVLHERAAAVLRGLGTTDGRLSVIEAPDQGAVDTETWIFAGRSPLEQPAGAGARSRRVAAELAAGGSGLRTIDATDTRLFAVPVRQGRRQLGTVVVGASLTPYEHSASSALLASVILGLLTLLGIAALSRWLISRALRPVSRLTARAAGWNDHDLSQRFFAGEPHDELTALASVFDGLLGRLAQSLRHEQRLTAEISHELRTPLAKILAEAELTSAGERSPQEHQRALRSIIDHAHDLQHVLETLLAASRASDSGAMSGDAAEAMQRAAAPFQDSLAGQGKAIELASARPAKVAVETDVVVRILSPLLENAVRYARTRVRVEVASAEGAVVLAIADDGPGVEEADREAIFEPGHRAGASGADAHHGAGLGLSLSRRLARAAGGEVAAAASSSGALFTVRLPAA
jgi:signal transduction histidine kinase